MAITYNSHAHPIKRTKSNEKAKLDTSLPSSRIDPIPVVWIDCHPQYQANISIHNEFSTTNTWHDNKSRMPSPNHRSNLLLPSPSAVQVRPHLLPLLSPLHLRSTGTASSASRSPTSPPPSTPPPSSPPSPSPHATFFSSPP